MKFTLPLLIIVGAAILLFPLKSSAQNPTNPCVFRYQVITPPAFDVDCDGVPNNIDFDYQAYPPAASPTTNPTGMYVYPTPTGTASVYLTPTPAPATVTTYVIPSGSPQTGFGSL